MSRQRNRTHFSSTPRGPVDPKDEGRRRSRRESVPILLRLLSEDTKVFHKNNGIYVSLFLYVFRLPFLPSPTTSPSRPPVACDTFPSRQTPERHTTSCSTRQTPPSSGRSFCRDLSSPSRDGPCVLVSVPLDTRVVGGRDRRSRGNRCYGVRVHVEDGERR